MMVTVVVVVMMFVVVVMMVIMIIIMVMVITSFLSVCYQPGTVLSALFIPFNSPNEPNALL